MPNSSALVAIVGMLAATSAGCGAHCENVISAQRKIRDQKTVPADGRPHAQLRLPHNRINVLLAAALARNEISAELPLAFRIALPAAKVEATRVEVVSAPDGALGFVVDVRMTIAGKELLGLSATVEAKAETNTRDGKSTLEIGFDADSLRSVKPDYPKGTLKSLASALAPIISAMGGPKVPPALMAIATRGLIQFINKEGFELIRDQVLARVGEVGRLRIDLGSAPVERMEVRSPISAQPALLVDLYTRLPVRVGLAEDPPSEDPISGTGRLRISGETLAELGNWAIAEGVAPQTYDSKLRPDENGAYVPVYAWREGERPLVIHAFRIKSPCSTIVVGARPEVKVEDGTITVGVADGNVEEVEGSTLVRLGVGLKSIFGGSIEKSETNSASARFEVGGRPLEARLIDANLVGGELDLTIELSLPEA